MYRNQECELRAKMAANSIQAIPGFPSGAVAQTAVVLGSGWGGHLSLTSGISVEIAQLPGFEGLGSLSGHRRVLRYGTMNGKPVLVLDGRIHLNESPAVRMMVRLQVELLFQLGVKNLILTCAAGSLREDIPVGSIVVVDGFVTLFAPEMPLVSGEFCSAEESLADSAQIEKIVRLAHPLIAHAGGYAMVPGPGFEGTRYDKPFIATTGASVVGMSMLPEAYIARLYDARVVGLCFVTNDTHEKHSHEENVRRVQQRSALLGGYLEHVIANL